MIPHITTNRPANGDHLEKINSLASKIQNQGYVELPASTEREALSVAEEVAMSAKIEQWHLIYEDGSSDVWLMKSDRGDDGEPGRFGIIHSK